MKNTILILAVMFTGAPAAAQDAHDLLQQAAYQERALGDLAGANQIYETILVRHAVAEREVAARALYQMAVNTDRMGQAETAARTFRRLIDEFPDQTRLVAEARRRIGSAPSGGDVVRKVVWDMAEIEGSTDGGPSPDGRFVAFAAWASGDIGIKDLETGEIRLVTEGGSWDEPARFADEPSWAKDGSEIAYVWWEGDEAYLKVVDVRSGAARTLAEGYFRPFTWTSDGRVLTEWRGDDRVARVAFVSTDDGTIDVVHELPPERSINETALSPDEAWILFDYVPDSSGSRELFVIPAEGGPEQVLAPHPGADSRGAWHPDGRTVVFQSNRSGAASIWRVRTADGRQDGEPELAFADMRHATILGFAGDGRLFVERHSSESPGNLYSLSLEPETVRGERPPVKIPLLGTGYNAGASYSSDGRYMSYISQRPNSVLVIRDLTTGRELQHKPAGGRLLKHRVDKPAWRPGSWQVLVAAGRGPVVMDAVSGSVISRLEIEMHRPTWSADGSEIWGLIDGMIGYVSFNEDESARDGYEPEVTAWRVLPDDEYCEGLAVHPTDGTVAYWCDYRDIYRFDPTTGQSTPWWSAPEGEATIAHHKNGSFAFSPDGQSLFFHRWRQDESNSQSQVWRLPVSGSDPVPVTGMIPGGWGFEMHPSGEHAIYTVLDGARNEMWVLEGVEGN